LTHSRTHRVEMCEHRIRHLMEQTIRKSQQSFSRVAGTLDALSPLAVLDRGYSVCQTPAGRVVRAADEVDVNSVLQIRLSRGSLSAVVTFRE
jgi:exodeoxyribonuclease VII large subunit